MTLYYTAGIQQVRVSFPRSFCLANIKTQGPEGKPFPDGRKALRKVLNGRLREGLVAPKAMDRHWPGIASPCEDLSNPYRELDDHWRASRYQKQAISAYRQAISAAENDERGSEWAFLQATLGNAYLCLPTGDRGENLREAIACYERALTIDHLSSQAWARYLRNLEAASARLKQLSTANE